MFHVLIDGSSVFDFVRDGSFDLLASYCFFEDQDYKKEISVTIPHTDLNFNLGFTAETNAHPCN